MHTSKTPLKQLWSPCPQPRLSRKQLPWILIHGLLQRFSLHEILECSACLHFEESGSDFDSSETTVTINISVHLAVQNQTSLATEEDAESMCLLTRYRKTASSCNFFGITRYRSTSHSRKSLHVHNMAWRRKQDWFAACPVSHKTWQRDATSLIVVLAYHLPKLCPAFWECLQSLEISYYTIRLSVFSVDRLSLGAYRSPMWIQLFLQMSGEQWFLSVRWYTIEISCKFEPV